ncbi:hydroxymethylbilane synthase [Leucobacter soli]|uniref:hydroxymethylbilane synthase n=1 Tax=Leucobacter soli TaxID=2812850 RepID=UPI003612C966
MRVGTRGSTLAVTQTTTVAEGIAEATGRDVALVVVRTQGDASSAPLAQLGGTGVFVSALRDALLAGTCDMIVHSIKDLPTGPCPGIALGAVPPRADPRDALCARDGLTLSQLPTGARVGTGSPRRAAQLLARRPDLVVTGLRGNVDTRLARLEQDLDAIVLAAAGLDRIGRASAVSERFPLESTPPAPGQGALAVEVRDAELGLSPYAEALAALDDAPSRACSLAERGLLAALEAGCAAPVGAWARIVGDRIVLRAAVYRVDGSSALTVEAARPWPLTGSRAGDETSTDESSAVASSAVESSADEFNADELAARLGRNAAADLLDRGAADLAPLGAGS